MTKVFGNQIGKDLKIYIDDMVVKTGDGTTHANDLQDIFDQLRRHNMRLNPNKCAFGISAGKFLGFMLT